MKKVVHDDDLDFENSKIEKSKNKEIEENKDGPLLEDLQRKKINMIIFPKYRR